jgi:ATP-dependent helicase/nuclease subunit B
MMARAIRLGYNAGMGNLRSGAAAEVDAWLRGGGAVVTASERTARACTHAFQAARRGEGLTAWPAPQIQPWQSLVRTTWEAYRGDGRVVMNSLQEKALWAEIIGAEPGTALSLEGPRQRLAEMAMEAHALLCAYAPRFLNPKARNGWQQDAAVFSRWVTEFDAACRAERLVSAANLPLELPAALEEDTGARPPLLLAGFDRLLPMQRKVFGAWGEARAAAAGEPAQEIGFYQAASEQEELAACALWCKAKLKANPGVNLLVVAQDVAARRGEMERAFLRFCGGDAAKPLFEFSLGVPFSGVAVARGAYLMLRWLDDALEESEIDWLFSSGLTTAGDGERYALTGFMRSLRRQGRGRTRWTVDALLAQDRHSELPPGWRARMAEAKRLLAESAGGPQSAWTWAELVPRLLEAAGWPGAQTRTSAEFQAMRRWQQTLDACASLGFDGRRMSWSDFAGALGRALDETLFAAESRQAPIQIAGPAESAGLSADAIWFMGASEEKWPAAGSMHPLIPFGVQREAGMPHAAAQLDWDVAYAATMRLLASAPEVLFSFPHQQKGVEQRSSRLVVAVAGAPRPLPAALIAPGVKTPVTTKFEDFSRVPLLEDKAAGGSTVLTTQSQCPFKAFATARLGAQGWQAAEAGLTSAQRGQLLHEVLHSVWGLPPRGIRTHADLAANPELRAFVENHVQLVLAQKLPSGARELMPQRYLQLEGERLTNLVTEWLEFERTRVEFHVVRTELDVTRTIAGLTLDLRLDRIDRLNDSSLLVIDYKTGQVSPKMWEQPRPEDVQLPLYAAYGLNEELRTEIAREFGDSLEGDAGGNGGRLGGLVFAKVRRGEEAFAGRVGNAKAQLQQDLGPNTELARKKLTAEELLEWRDCIAQLARDFLAGRADVDPRDPVMTCRGCDLHVLCRVHEAGAALGEDEEASDE